MVIFDGRTRFPCHINIPKIGDIIDAILKIWLSSIKLYGLEICVRNGIFFYFNDICRLKINIYKIK